MISHLANSCLGDFALHRRQLVPLMLRGERRSSHSAADPGWPHPIHSSASILHHKSGFQAHATRFRPSASQSDEESLEPLFAHLAHLFPKTKRATHQMYAWRASAIPSPTVSSPIASATSTSTASMASGASDGGESGAGERLSRLLELSGCSNVVVVVYRWYGGVQLGSDRWKCISGVAKEALRAGGFIEGSGEQLAGASSTKKGSEAKTGKKGRKR